MPSIGEKRGADSATLPRRTNKDEPAAVIKIQGSDQRDNGGGRSSAVRHLFLGIEIIRPRVLLVNSGPFSGRSPAGAGNGGGGGYGSRKTPVGRR